MNALEFLLAFFGFTIGGGFAVFAFSLLGTTTIWFVIKKLTGRDILELDD